MRAHENRMRAMRQRKKPTQDFLQSSNNEVRVAYHSRYTFYYYIQTIAYKGIYLYFAGEYPFHTIFCIFLCFCGDALKISCPRSYSSLFICHLSPSTILLFHWLYGVVMSEPQVIITNEEHHSEDARYYFYLRA